MKKQLNLTMGLVETLFENISAKSVVVFVVGALVLRFVLQRVDEYRRIRRLGRPGRRIPSYAPLGE